MKKERAVVETYYVVSMSHSMMTSWLNVLQ
jgi:hypothetical protein